MQFIGVALLNAVAHRKAEDQPRWMFGTIHCDGIEQRLQQLDGGVAIAVPPQFICTTCFGRAVDVIIGEF